MRLTNTHRKAFVSAVMKDVPVLDYDDMFEKLVKQDMIKHASPKLAAALKDKELYSHIISGNVSVSAPSVNHNGRNRFHVLSSVSCYRGYQMSAEALAQARELALKKAQSDDDRGALEAKLEGVAHACTTREALVKALPELEKYMPDAEAPVAKNLPAIANLVADLTRAGWPKGQKLAAA